MANNFHDLNRQTSVLAGPGKSIEDAPIHLTIRSRSAVDLTLVDLPGITRVAVADQPKDIEEQVRNLVTKYIENKDAIILAVTAANQDLANSDALALARVHDPEGERTIGVLTKVDLMDPGTDAGAMLRNQLVPLRLGYVAVVNRGQKAIAEGTSLNRSMEAEAEFFRSHPVYCSMPDLCTSRVLTRKMSEVLAGKIEEVLPEIRKRLTCMLVDCQREMEGLGSSSIELDEMGKMKKLLNLVSKFSAAFQASLEGRDTSIADMKELRGVACILHIFHEVFSKSMLEDGHPLKIFDPPQSSIHSRPCCCCNSTFLN